MPYDEILAGRVRGHLGRRAGLAEKRMFGGLAFLLRGNMCCGVHGNELIVRLDPARTAEALSARHTRPFDLTGQPMKGWILVASQGLATEAALGKWVDLASSYAAALAPK